MHVCNVDTICLVLYLLQITNSPHILGLQVIVIVLESATLLTYVAIMWFLTLIC